MDLRAGEEPMYLTRKTRVKTKSEYLTVWDPAVYRQPRMWRSAVTTFKFGGKAPYIKEKYTNLIVVTQAQTPFIDLESSPGFRFVFNHKTLSPQSWVDVIISSKFDQKSLPGGNCFAHYPLYETILMSRTGSYKLAAIAGRMYSILVNSNQSQNKTVKFAIKVSTRFRLLKTKFNTNIKLEWASLLELSRDMSRKIIALPGTITSVTVKILYPLQNYTVDLHWIHDMFNGSSFQSNTMSLCNKDLLKSSKHTYCLNYTSVRNSYVFLWNIYRYRKSETHKSYFMYEWPGFYQKSLQWEQLRPEGTVAKSWTEVSEFCKSIGGSLPLIRNRDELDTIVTFLKLSEDMPPVEALYIGIKRSFIQVVFLQIQFIHMKKMSVRFQDSALIFNHCRVFLIGKIGVQSLSKCGKISRTIPSTK